MSGSSFGRLEAGLPVLDASTTRHPDFRRVGTDSVGPGLKNPDGQNQADAGRRPGSTLSALASIVSKRNPPEGGNSERDGITVGQFWFFIVTSQKNKALR